MSLPSYDEAVSDIRQTITDVGFLRSAASAVSAILNESEVENKSEYRKFQIRLQTDIARGERLIDGIQNLINKGEIAKPEDAP